MTGPHLRPLRRIVLLIDGAILVASMAAAKGLHAWLQGVLEVIREPPPFRQYAVVVYLAVPMWLTLVTVLGLDRSFERTTSLRRLLLDLVRLHAFGLVGLALVLFATQAILNRSMVALFLASTFVLMFLERAAIGSYLRYQHESGQSRTRLLLVGDPSDEMAAFVRAAGREDLPPRVVGRLGASAEAGSPDAAEAVPPYCGELPRLERILHEEAIDHVVFFPPLNHPDRLSDSLKQCELLGVPASFALDMARPGHTSPRLVSLYERPFLSYELAPKRPDLLGLKHAFDFAASLVAVVVLAPLLLAVAAAVLVTMGRPILFAQQRVGLHGRRFRMLKFRTMVPGAERQRTDLAALNEMNGPVFKLRNDPRVTPLGRLLRRTSLDELPQLFNVLAGSMSLVGPRPLPVDEQDEIRGSQRRRLAMKPGITGLWQISGRNDVAFDDWMALDLRYVDQWSLGRDLLILMKTIPIVLSGAGAH